MKQTLKILSSATFGAVLGLAGCESVSSVKPSTGTDTPPPATDNSSPTGPAAPAASPLRAGTYVADECFLNKNATQTFGSPVYTKASMSLDANGTGTNDFSLYLNATCSGEAAQVGRVNIQVSYELRLGDVLAYRMVQEDPSVIGDDPQTFFLTAVIDGDDYLMDLDFGNGSSGPYTSVPTEGEVADFGRDPAGRGVRFRKQ